MQRVRAGRLCSIQQHACCLHLPSFALRRRTLEHGDELLRRVLEAEARVAAYMQQPLRASRCNIADASRRLWTQLREKEAEKEGGGREGVGGAGEGAGSYSAV